MKNLVHTLKSDLARSRVLSLDVFDTCVLRRVGQPVNAFDIIEHSLATDPKLHVLSGGRLAFRDVRPHAEQGARKRLLAAKKTSEVRFDEIYAELQLITGLDQCEIKRLQEIELDVERKLVMANPSVLSLARYARERGIQVVFISDMYHSREFVGELLTICGFEPDLTQVFVSSEYRKAKWGDGALFDVVSRTLNVPLNRFIHVGDNPDADVAAPKRKGMRAYHTRKLADEVVALDVIDRRSAYMMPRPEKSLALGIRDGVLASNLATGADARISDDFWFKIGYERVGILFLGFIQWLIKRCQDDNIDTLVFFARDGYITKRAFDYVCQVRGLDIKTVYMYASRRALVFPALVGINQPALDSLVAGSGMTVRMYLERWGLDAERYDYDARLCGFESLDARVKEPHEYANMGRLFTVIGPDVLASATRESELVQRYFDQLDLPQTGRLAVMDVGWHGSLQESLTTLLRLSGRSCSVKGYYLGLHQGAHSRIAKGHAMSGYLTTVGQPEDLNTWILSCVELVEFLLLAPHGSCLGFTESDGQIVPILEDDPTEVDNREKAAIVQEGAMQFLEAARPLLKEFPTLEIDPRGALYPYAQIIMDPTLEEARTLGDLTHEQNLGQGRWYLANPDAVKRKKMRLDTVFWKIGYQRRQLGH